MRIGRTLPPAAAPIGIYEVTQGLLGLLQGEAALERLRTELKAHYVVRHVALVSSGKAGLTLILQALRDLRPERDEVLIPAYTCYSVPSAIVRAGLNVKLCDIDPETLDFDSKALPKEILSSGRRLLAVVPVHLFGLPADVERVKELVDSNVFVVEDAAQAMGGFETTPRPGALGDAGLFSLGRGKALSSVEGGIILSNRSDIGGALDARVNKLPGYSPGGIARLILQAFGLLALMRPSLFWIPKAIPWLRLGETLFDTTFPLLRMSGFQAGILSFWRNKLYDLNRVRTSRVKRWQDALQSLNGRAFLTVKPQKAHGARFIRLPIMAHSPALARRITAESEKQGLGIMPGYPASLNRVRFLKGPFTERPFPGAEETAKSLLTLPIHPFVSHRDIQRAAGFLNDAAGKNDLL